MVEVNTLYQHGTLAALVPGLFAGTLTAGELLQHGDTGIGTLAGLDGELVVLNGVIYQINHQGGVRRVRADETVPFANIHFANFAVQGAIQAQSYADLRAELVQRLATRNAFSALCLHGEFAMVTTRAVAGQKKPYPTLVATAADQSVFKRAHVTGTVIGYYAPDLYAGAAAPGLHLHFLSEDKTFGGHILDITGTDGVLELQPFSNFNLHLPINNPEFRQQDFTSPQIVADIEQAEH